jgi:flagellar protein FliS
LAYTNALSAYRETRVKTASQGNLVIMLYDEAIKQLDYCLELLPLHKNGEKKDPANIEKMGKAIVKTQDVITELMVSLDFEKGQDIAKNLFGLYNWFNQELLESNISKDTRRIVTVRNMLNELRSAWHEIIAKNAAEDAGNPVSGVNIAG